MTLAFDCDSLPTSGENAYRSDTSAAPIAPPAAKTCPSLSAGCAIANTESSASAANAPKSIGTIGIRRHTEDDGIAVGVGHACSVPNRSAARRSRALLQQMLADVGRHFEHRQLLIAVENRPQIVVGANHPAILRVLQIVFADVLPKFAHGLAARERFASHDVRQLRGRRDHSAHRAARGPAGGLRRFNDPQLALFFPFDWHRLPP